MSIDEMPKSQMEKQVVSVELSKQLTECITAPSEFEWTTYGKDWSLNTSGHNRFFESINAPLYEKDPALPRMTCIPAYTLSELNEIVPDRYVVSKVGGVWLCYEHDGGYNFAMTNIIGIQPEEAEVNVKAILLLYLAKKLSSEFYKN